METNFFIKGLVKKLKIIIILKKLKNIYILNDFDKRNKNVDGTN